MVAVTVGRSGMIVYGPTCETTGLSPEDHELVSVQFAQADGEVTMFPRWEYDGEADLLAAFLKRWDDIERKRSEGGALFVGINHLSFDLPFLLARCRHHRDELADRGWLPGRCWAELYRWPIYFDLAHLVGGDLVGMATLRRELIGTEPEHGGRDVPVLYRNGRHEAIATHVSDRLGALREIHLALRGTDLYRELVKFRRRIGASRDLA